MSKKYVSYTADDLVLDKSFSDWVLFGKDNLFWRKIIKSDPKLALEIEKAIKIINLLQNTETKIPKSYDINYRKQIVWENINKEVVTKRRIKINLKTTFYIAASLLIIAGLATLFNSDKVPSTNEIGFTKVEFENINEVQLVLNDGTELDINNTNDDFTGKDGTHIINDKNRTLIYNKTKPVSTNTNYNQIIIPKGKRHNIILADGTKVWLNSESTLQYPTQFINDKRVVLLQGEAYFDVATDKSKPFVVKTSNFDVNVTGTAFNVKAYKNEKLHGVTLEEGSVEITMPGLVQKAILNPGERLIYSNQDKKLKRRNVDTKLHTSWRNGKYIFKSEKLKSLIVTINRWYNVNVVCKDEAILDYMFTGEISEDRTIGHIMQLIKLSSKINYTIEDEQIIITK